MAARHLESTSRLSNDSRHGVRCCHNNCSDRDIIIKVSTAEAVDIQQSASGGAHRQPAPRPEQGADGRQAS